MHSTKHVITIQIIKKGDCGEKRHVTWDRALTRPHR